MTTAHDAWLQPGTDDDLPELSAGDVEDVCDHAVLDFFADDGKEVTFETLRGGQYALGVIAQHWALIEAANKHGPRWAEIAKGFRAILKLCDKAQSCFDDAYAMRQRIEADSRRAEAEEFAADARADR